MEGRRAKLCTWKGPGVKGFPKCEGTVLATACLLGFVPYFMLDTLVPCPLQCMFVK